MSLQTNTNQTISPSNITDFSKTQLIESLYEIDAIKFGNFTLKSGIVSPIYIDFRRLVSYPTVLQQAIQAIATLVQDKKFDRICGVPYGAFPLAIGYSLQYQKSMIMPRREIKNYGVNTPIEGTYRKDETILIIEDLITSGASTLEILNLLKKEKLKATDVVVILNREQGGKQQIEKHALSVHAIFTMSDLLNTLYDKDKIDGKTVNNVKTFIAENQF